jgi:hypothetical protein
VNPILVAAVLAAGAAVRTAGVPEVSFVPGTPILFPAETDSNSPAFWIGDRLHVLNSYHHPYISDGRSVAALDEPIGVSFQGGVVGPRWMESVLKAPDGTLYGYYHHEPAGVCGSLGKTMPQIGAARSEDGGLSWTDLGIVLSASLIERRCDTPNLYFVGGEGDFSAVLDAAGEFVYFFFSVYSPDLGGQGISAARMPWVRRNNPAGAALKFRDGAWTSPGRAGRATPIHPAAVSWHDPESDAFWGPSVHWNSFLNLYVMLMTRTGDAAWSTEGIYVSYAARLDDPSAWTPPARLIEGGAWYPQVIGLQRGVGTDSYAGEYARFFMGGRSDWYIRFSPPPAAAPSN